MRHNKLTMLIKYYKLCKLLPKCQLVDAGDAYQVLGSFNMNKVEIDYSDASDPASILLKLKNEKTNELIESILDLAGEKQCQENQH